MGYHEAGFDVTGVDLSPEMAAEYALAAGGNPDDAAKKAKAIKERYPFPLIQADALEYLAAHWQEYDAFHASPPCQKYSIMNNLPWLQKINYSALILPTRLMFQGIHAESGKPWVIENVYGARYGAIGLKKRGLEEHGMQAGYLCGTMFGLRMYRHRLFETSFGWLAPAHGKHQGVTVRAAYASEGSGTSFFEHKKREDGTEMGWFAGEHNQAAGLIDPPYSGHDDTPFWKRGKWVETASIKSRRELRDANRGSHLSERTPEANAVIEQAFGNSRTPGQRGIHSAADVAAKKYNHGVDGMSFSDQAIGAHRVKGNGAQREGVGVGHAKGWRLAAEAMGVPWMDRRGTTQAIPPVMTAFIGRAMLAALGGPR